MNYYYNPKAVCRNLIYFTGTPSIYSLIQNYGVDGIKKLNIGHCRSIYMYFNIK